MAWTVHGMLPMHLKFYGITLLDVVIELTSKSNHGVFCPPSAVVNREQHSMHWEAVP